MNAWYIVAFSGGFILAFFLLVLANKRLKRYAGAIVFIDARMQEQNAVLARLDKSKAKHEQVQKLKAVAFGRLQELGKVRGFLTGAYKWEK